MFPANFARTRHRFFNSNPRRFWASVSIQTHEFHSFGHKPHGLTAFTMRFPFPTVGRFGINRMTDSGTLLHRDERLRAMGEIDLNSRELDGFADRLVHCQLHLGRRHALDVGRDASKGEKNDDR